ncbi:MAG TPA: PAS domain S-box protein, partial [Abditibacteriaceae bacterium]
MGDQPLENSTASSFMHALIESADDAIISQTLDGVITSWNKGAERIFGYKQEEMIGQPITTLIPPNLIGEEQAILDRVRSGQQVEHYETIRRRQDGTLVDISLTVSPMEGADGEVIGASKIARDITAIRRTEQQLVSREDRYRTLLNSIDEGFCILEIYFDGDERATDWRYLEVNSAFEEHSGLVNAAGKRVRELLPDLEQHWFDIYGKVALTGEPIRLVQGSELLNRWFDLYAFRVDEPEDHRVAVLYNDITAKRMAELEHERLLRQLEGERAKFAYLFNEAPAFVATLVGPQHVFELTNIAYMQLIGHRDVVGKSLREAIPELEGQGFFELIDNVYQTGEPFIGRELPAQLQRKPDAALEQRYVDFVFQPIFETDGTVSGILVHGIDITEMKRSRDRQTFLAEATSVIASSLDYQSTLAGVAGMSVPALADWCAVDLLEDDNSIKRLAVVHIDPKKVQWAHELEKRYPPDPNSPHGVPNVLRTGKSELYIEITDAMLVEGAIDDEHLQMMREVGFSSGMV